MSEPVAQQPPEPPKVEGEVLRWRGRAVWHVLTSRHHHYIYYESDLETDEAPLTVAEQQLAAALVASRAREQELTAELADARQQLAEQAPVVTMVEELSLKRAKALSDKFAAEEREQQANELLRDIEWGSGVPRSLAPGVYCPSCGQYRSSGHRPNCKLARHLAGTTTTTDTPTITNATNE